MRANCPDSRLLGRLSNLFKETARVLALDHSGHDSFGQPTGTWGALAGHAAIPCLVGSKTGGETERADYTPVVGNYSVLLKGYYPEIREKMRVSVGAESYDVLLVRHDPLKLITVLDVNRTEV